MSDCEEYQELISRMLDGDLSEDESARLRAHVSECAECRRVLDAFTMLRDTMAEDLQEPPADLAAAVMEQIRQEAVPIAKKRRVSPVRWIALAACLAIVVFSAYRFELFGGGNKTASAADVANGSAQFMYAAKEAEIAVEEAPAAEPAEGYVLGSVAKDTCAPVPAAIESYSQNASEHCADSAAGEAPAYLDYAGERWQPVECVEAPPDSGVYSTATDTKAEELSVMLFDGRLYLDLKNGLWAVYEK